MSCFNPFHKKSNTFILSTESININFNQIDFIINDGKSDSSCKIVLYGEPACVRLILGGEGRRVADCGEGERVEVVRGDGTLRAHSGKLAITMQYRPWQLSVWYCGTLVCQYRLQKSGARLGLVAETKGGRLYGLVERASASRLSRGRRYRLYNTDEFGLAPGSDKPLYGSVPFVMAQGAGGGCVGLLSGNEGGTEVRLVRGLLGSSCSQHWSFETGGIDMSCVAGEDSLEVRRALLQLTGVTPLPPLFSLGYHQCRWNYNDQEDLLQVDARLREAGIPCDVLWLDIEHTDGKRYFTWDKDKFDPQVLINKLKEKGRHLVVIIDPHLKVDPDYPIYKEALEAGYLVKNEDGSPLIGECWPGSSSWVDYISDDASSWWSEKIFLYLKEFGCSGEYNNLWIWNDMNEPSVFKCPDNQMNPSALHDKGIEHRFVHNIYGQRMAMATWNGILKACDNKLRPFLLTRSFYSGSQKYGAIWTGDSLCNWDQLRISIPMMLSLSICGIDFCGADVGGFYGDPTPELLCRWYQLGAFQPFFRAHAHMESQRREPYLIEEPYKSAIKNAICLRYKLLAYWYLCFWYAEKEFLPVVSPVWMIFPKSLLSDSDKAYMIGKHILVRPIVSPLCRSINILLPGDKNDLWYQYCYISLSWKLRIPGKKLKIAISIDSIPVFYFGGSCIFMKTGDFSNTEEWLQSSYNIVFFPDRLGNASSLFYSDDCHSLRYKSHDENILLRCTLNGKNNSMFMEKLHLSPNLDSSLCLKISQITIIKNGSSLLSKWSSVLFEKEDKTVTDYVWTHFEDRMELSNINLEMSETWSLKMK